ncbi:MAG: hypothetical protein VXZ72_00585 [Chlamydiota bacterium]|nr:hypothetical protein [Chlamydiota bacterium]
MYKPMVTTRFVMMQVLAEFAQQLGVSRQYAEMLSHVHVLQAESFEHWQRFIMSQCSRCEKSMESCSFIHPKDDESSGASGAEISVGNRAAVACGRIKDCPVLKVKAEPTLEKEPMPPPE